MRKFTLGIFMLALMLSALSFTGCFLYEDPDLSKCPQDVRIELQWIGVDPLDDTEKIPVTVYSQNSLVLDTLSDINGIDVLLHPAVYEVVGWEEVPNVAVTGHTVSLLADRENRFLPVTRFSAGSGRGEIVAEKTEQVILLPMREQVRELVIMVEFTGNIAPQVTGIGGELHGTALSRDVSDAFPPQSGRQRPYATTRTDAIYDFGREVRSGKVWFTGENNLLGIDGDSDQVLDLSVTFSDGETVVYPVDVTGLMTGFHTVDVLDPWYIVLRLNISMDMLFTIEDWYGGAELYLDAQ